jgi:hypothetical protein
MKMHRKLKKHGDDVAAKIISAIKNPLVANPSWVNDVPYLGGVYVLWKKFSKSWTPIYVGESSNLNDRLAEMTCLGRHNALWKLTDKEGIKIRNISILKLPEIKGITISYIVLPIGRKEAEEFLIHLWRKEVKLNKNDKRFARRSDWNAFEALQK